MLLACTILTSFISYFITAFFNQGVYFFLSFFSIVILNIEILSLFKKISGINILLITILEFLFAFFFWYKNGKRRLTVNCNQFFLNLKEALLGDKSLIILGLFWLFVVGLSFILASLSPVNEPDAQGYHVLRSLFWVQDGYINHFDITDIRAHCMPVNSELFYGFVLALSKNDCTLGLLEFFSYIFLLFSSFKIMEFYKIDFSKRLWAIFIFSSFAGVISQISSTQTDLVVGTLFSISIYLFLEYKKETKLHLLYFSALSLAISFGVKSTGLIGAVPILVWYLISLSKEKRNLDIIKYLAFLVLNFLIFSSYNYILNFINYGNFLGSNSAIISHKFWGGPLAIVANFIKYIFQLFDFSGFVLGFYLNDTLQKMQQATLGFFNIPLGLGENVGLKYTNIGMTEQFVGFGVLGFLLFLPSSLIGFFKKETRLFSTLFWLQILILSSAVAYMIFSIRFIVSFMAVAIPVLSISYFKKMNIIKFFYIFFAIFYMGYASLFLSQRPMRYLFDEFKKTHNLPQIQENMRDLNYKFYPSFNEAFTMKSEVLPLCLNGNKIAIFASQGYMLYSAKYLEFENDCKIDTPSVNHIENYNLNYYDFLILQKNSFYTSQIINKYDIINPFVKNEKAMCFYVGKGLNNNKIQISSENLKNATEATCLINEYFIESLGFNKVKEFKSKIPKYLEHRNNETVREFVIYKKD